VTISEIAITMSAELGGNSIWVTGLTHPDCYKLFFESAGDDVPKEAKYPAWINAK